MDKETINVQSLISSKDKKDTKKVNFMKFLSGKYLKIIILAILGISALIIFLGADKKSNNDISDANNVSKNYITTMEYCTELENKLESVLSQIKGAGQVKVMLSVDGSPELVYAVDSDTKVSNTNNGSTTTNSSSPIIVQTGSNMTPLILTENLPIVKGVIVVSSGANDIGIKLDILNAVSTLLDISTEKISVLKGI